MSSVLVRVCLHELVQAGNSDLPFQDTIKSAANPDYKLRINALWD
jgi:hypothetical protein